MKQKGTKFAPGEVKEWLDCGNYKATVYTNQRVLEFIKDEDIVDASLKSENSVIIEPCFIGKNVNLNLSNVQYMDSSGISVLIESHQKALEKGTKLVIKDVSKSVLKVIMMAKLEQILNLE